MFTQASFRSFALLLVLLGVLAPLQAQDSSPVVSSNYRLNPSDIILLEVFQEPDLRRQVRLAQDGSVVLPLIGKVMLSDKTVFEAEEIITDLYNRDYLVNPQINISILEYAERRVNVLGSVNRPGSVVFQPEEEMVLLEAITLAGGFNRYADKKRVTLTRKKPNGQTESFEINTEDLIRGGNMNNWTLRKDDVIFVPERVF